MSAKTGKIIQSGLPGGGEVTAAAVLGEFLADLTAQGRSPATVTAYGKDLRAFAAACKLPLAAVRQRDLVEYLRGLARHDGAPLAMAGLARRRASLRAFFAWCVDMGLVASSPAERLPSIKVPDHQPRALPDADVIRVLKALDDPRDRLLFQLMADTGARVSEVLNIRLESIRLHARELTVRGKGNRERTLHLDGTEALRLLKVYLRQEGWLARDGETVLGTGLLLRPDANKQRAGRPGGPLHYTGARRAWKAACEAAGLPEATIHQLRHAFATSMINRGVRVETLQSVLGHRNVQTTMRYAKVSDETVRRELEAARRAGSR